MADDPVQWDDPVMAAIAKLGDDLRGDLTAIERMVGLYYRR